MMQQTPSAAAVVPSRDPSRDARSLADLAGPRFARLDDGEGAGTTSTRAVVLSSDGDASTPPASVVFVDFGSARRRDRREAPIPPESESDAVPNCTVMVAADLIRHVARNANAISEDGTIKFSINDEYSWAVIRISGGGTLLLASSVQAVHKYALGACAENPIDNEAAANGNGTAGSPVDDIMEEPPYKFPSLAMSILSNKRVIPGFRINTRAGVPIESDLFVGRVLLIMRPPDPTADPYWNERVFSKKKRRLEIQIQGRFKYVPRGTVWCGFEVTEEMRMGLVSKGLCNLLLRLVSKTVPGDMHFSFGDKKGEELPHICFPARTLFDRVVVTRPGETPPPLGEVLPETPEAASRRKRSGDPGEWNTDDTYSFSYHSMYLDLSIWHVVNLPTADMDLKTFWRDSLLRIVVYESSASAAGDRHLTAENRYIAGIQAEFLGFDDDDDGGIGGMLEENDALPLDQGGLSKMSRSISNAKLNPYAENDTASVASFAPSSLGVLDVSHEESDSENTVFYDAADAPRENEGAVLEGVRDLVDIPIETGLDCSDAPDNVLLYDKLCPGWIQMCSSQKGKYTKVFAFAGGASGGTGEGVIFRTACDFANLFPLSEAKLWAEKNCSPRLSGAETLRRVMGYTLAGCGNTVSARCQQRCRALWNQPCAFDHSYLKRSPPPDAKPKSGRILFAGYVGRSLSERHWIEEWVVVTDRLILFYHPNNKRPSYRIHLTGILGAEELQDGSDHPYFPSYHFLAVETISRVIYIMFRTRDACIEMLEALRNRLPLQGSAPPSSDIPPTFDDPSQEFLHKSSLYKCEERRLLNNRKFAFDSLGKVGFDGVGKHPLAMVQDALRKVLVPNLMDVTDRAILRDFLDAASELKRANLTGLSETEKVAFFINLYHVMLMHGFLVFGTPVTLFEFVNYFGKVAYEVGDDIFSLKELEHNIIRANMSSPSQFFGRFVLPKQVYKHALKKGDHRINFALNCGSLSNPATVQVYTAKDLDFQLDEASREYLKVAKSSSSGRTLTLPKICQWYANDFGKGRTQDVVRLAEKYLSGPDQRLLSSSLAEIRVRHFGYDYKCRYLIAA